MANYWIITKPTEKNFAGMEQALRTGAYDTVSGIENARKFGRNYLRKHKNGFVIIGDYNQNIVGIMEYTDGKEFYRYDPELATMHTGYAYSSHKKNGANGLVGPDGKLTSFSKIYQKTRAYNRKKYGVDALTVRRGYTVRDY